MIETLVSLLLMAIALLTVLAMQLQSLRLAEQGASYAHAALLAGDIAQTLRAQPLQAIDPYMLAYDDATPKEPACMAKSEVCTQTQTANWHLAKWRKSIAQNLPGGRCEIVQLGEHLVVRIEFTLSYDKQQQSLAKATYELVVAELG